jgi:uncharacterized damage-inducible protein DinB
MDRATGRSYYGGEEQGAVGERIDNVEGEMRAAARRIFAANERMNQMLIKELDPAAWKAKPAGGVRTIAAIFTHIHNVRCKWVRLSAPHLKVPALLNRARCTPEVARAGLAESGERCVEMLVEALGPTGRVPGGRVTKFLRDGLARAWPAGPEMVAYMVAHEAHHRGQICMLAHQLGFPLAGKVTGAMWNWERIWKE